MIPAHPLAEIFPLLDEGGAAELAADIAANGLRDRIVLFEEKILDGRNRYKGLIDAGRISATATTHELVQRRFAEDFSRARSGEPLEWVLSKNLVRRHLSESQRALVAAALANLKQGRPADHRPPEGEDNSANWRDLSPVKPVTQADAAQRLNVSERSVQRGRQVLEHGAPELVEAVKRDEMSVSAAAALSQRPVGEQLAILQGRKTHSGSGPGQPLPNGARAIMASRAEPDDSLDYFPTPPWATRALFEMFSSPALESDSALSERLRADALQPLGQPLAGAIWDPACGEGHMTAVFAEYGAEAFGTDVFDYSADGRAPVGWLGAHDYLGPEIEMDADWIITNPPFRDLSLEFALRAIAQARVGVALFVRQQWLEGVGRYERLFRDLPPTLYAQFAERVNLCKGRWDPEGDTATAYCWLVWIRGAAPCPPVWIPPGRREALARPDDVERFTAHPVLPPAKEIPAGPPAEQSTDLGAGPGDEGSQAQSNPGAVAGAPDPQIGAAA